ncbi:MAG TPA: hypothetical protein VFB79_23630 [Candidatus Angelobacter sp.]|nr:hypothetical protein [Candidatus Angelobacter sp.]
MQKQLVVLSGLRSLRIASSDGAPANEYRIQQNTVEFRSVNADGRPYQHPNGQWRVLDDSEILLHFALQTPVAEWLDKTLYSSAAQPMAA